MTEAVLEALAHVWATLKTLNVPMAVMGGVALAAWKRRRTTFDVDLLLNVDESDIDRVVETLRTAKIRTQRIDPKTVVGDAIFLQLVYEPPDRFVDVRIDLLLANSEYLKAALARRTQVDSAEFGCDFDVLSGEDLVILKLQAGRIIDQADAAALLRVNRETLDIDYLQRWIHTQGLDAQFAQIWDEAFPGETPPGLEHPQE